MQRRVVMVFVGAALACADLVDKAFTHATYHHQRSAPVVVMTTLVVVALVALVPRIPSGAALVGAAIAVGGAAGNVVAASLWTKGVPDPIVIRGASAGIAFNLADVFIFVGDATLMSAVLIYAVRNRALLRTSM